MTAIFNGQLQEQDAALAFQNRAFSHADLVQEFFLIQDKEILNLEEHYFNLSASMRIFRMKIPASFTQEHLLQNLQIVAQENQVQNHGCLEMFVFRAADSNKKLHEQETHYWIQVAQKREIKQNYSIDVYKDYRLNTNLYNRIHKPNFYQGFAQIFCQENDLDDLILLNHQKKVAKTLHGSLFLIQNQTIKTPNLENGATQDVARNQLIQWLEKTKHWQVQETDFFAFELTKTQEVFVLYSNYQIQSVTQMRKKTYGTEKTDQIRLGFQEVF